jgi:fructoselysine and glucoselysine-specific PTS system IIA component
MRYFIVASHGAFAEGIMDSVRMILGDVEGVRCYGAYTDPEEDVEESVKDMLACYGEEDELVVVTDIMGGSVCNHFVRQLSRRNLHVLAGMNLGFLLELFANRDAPLSEMIEAATGYAKTSVCYCNDVVREMMDE